LSPGANDASIVQALPLVVLSLALAADPATLEQLAIKDADLK